jgi:hypothetical protein
LADNPHTEQTAARRRSVPPFPSLFSTEDGESPGVGPRWEFAAIAMILLAAAALRLIRIASLPPGLFQDEAVYGVNAETILGGIARIYYGEREPMFEYLTAAVMLVLGRTPLALRVTAALVGTVGVAAGGALACQLFGRRIGLLTAAGMAASLWLTMLSRVGFRAITFPTVECLGLALLWRATRTGRARDFALSGAVLGLCLYTYLASRFLPVALITFVVVSFILDRQWMRKQLSGFVVAGIAAVVVCLPLGAYALRHPEMLMGRPDQVALPGGSAFLPALMPNVGRTLGMLFFHGDENWRQNFSGAPVFDPLNSLVFLAGLFVALRRRRPATTLVLVLLVVMLVPSMLSIDSPHYLRTEGAAVAVYAIWALGVAWMAQAASKLLQRARAHPSALPRAKGTDSLHQNGPEGGPRDEATMSPKVRSVGAFLPAAIVAIVLTVAVARTGWTYFVDYARNPAVSDAFSANIAAAGRFLSASPIWKNDRSNVFVTDRYYVNRGSIGFFLYPQLTPDEQAHWLDEQAIGTFFSQDKTIPLPVAPSIYVVDGDGQTALDSLGPAVQRTAWIYDDDRVAGRAIWAAPSSADWFGRPDAARFGRWLELERVLVRPTTVALRWRVLAIPTYQPSIYVHVVDGQHHTLTTADQVVGFRVQDWRVGQEFVTWHPIHLPPGTPPGQYQLTAGVYRKETGAREPVVLAGRTVPDVSIGELTITEPVAGTVAVAHRINHSVAPGLNLVGYDLGQTEVEAGTSVPLTLVWQATEVQRASAETNVSLRSPSGMTLGEWRGPVGTAAYPTTQWPAGTTIRQLVDVPVAATASGAATISVTVRVGDGQPSVPPVDIAKIDVKASTHQFSAPHPQYPLSVEFAGVGTLVGYDLPDRDYRPGEIVPLTLYWHSKGSISTAYTVFVHLLDARSKVVGQRDEPPVHGSRPTTSWVSEEYVTDEHDVPVDSHLTPGTYQVEVGLYDPRTGQRVNTGTPDNRVLIGSVRVGAGATAAQH